MRVAFVLLASFALGGFVALFYRCLQSLSESPRFEAFVARFKPAHRHTHNVFELVAVLLTLPVLIGPFALVLTAPAMLAARVQPNSPVLVVLAPIGSLITLAAVMRIMRSRKDRRVAAV